MCVHVSFGEGKGETGRKVDTSEGISEENSK